jgi:hypothetical protein
VSRFGRPKPTGRFVGKSIANAARDREPGRDSPEGAKSGAAGNARVCLALPVSCSEMEPTPACSDLRAIPLDKAGTRSTLLQPGLTPDSAKRKTGVNSMKKRYAGLAVVLLSLAAFGVGNADEIYGVINPNGHAVWVDTTLMTFPMGGRLFVTTGWGSDSVLFDTFDFGEITGWPVQLKLLGRIDGSSDSTTFQTPARDSWYPFRGGTPPAPMAKFYSVASGVEESRFAIGPRQCLSVSPSVVTSQMTVRVEATGSAMVEVRDAVGNLVRTLNCTDGAATWSREDGFGRIVPEGIYFCRYATSDRVAVRKILVTH